MTTTVAITAADLSGNAHRTHTVPFLFDTEAHADAYAAGVKGRNAQVLRTAVTTHAIRPIGIYRMYQA
jgi:hypothetical protein